MKAIIGACALALAAASAAPALAADAKPGQSCFWMRDIQSHSFGGPSTIYLRVANRDVVQLETKGNCTAGHMQGDPLIFNPAPLTGRVCNPIDLDLKIGSPAGGPPTPCIVDSIRKLSPAEAKALPKKIAP